LVWSVAYVLSTIDIVVMALSIEATYAALLAVYQAALLVEKGLWVGCAGM
jgi:hypothetical protein